MQTKRIKCPNCGVTLDVKNSKNEEVKQIICPKCKAILRVTFPPQQEPLKAETVYCAPKPKYSQGVTQLGSADGATQLVGKNDGATRLASPQQKTKIPKLLFGGEEYSLQEGRNVVGRKASSSTATVQISTADRYMSRQHVVITVTTLPDGSLKVVLCNDQNKNATLVDGQVIDAGDAIRLIDGNSITMGKTTVTFKLY